MNYKLAKKLKDAGFPQRKEMVYSLTGGKSYWGSNIDDGTEEGLSIPTLSELIEACGDGFKTLMKSDKGNYFMCTFRGKLKGKFVSLHSTCKTPEEAVANLWLAINKIKGV